MIFEFIAEFGGSVELEPTEPPLETLLIGGIDCI